MKGGPVGDRDLVCPQDRTASPVASMKGGPVGDRDSWRAPWAEILPSPQ